MLICYLDLSRTEDFSLFKCPGVGTFKVFSGTGKFRNKIECSYRKDSTIPPGSYWIVDRPTGGIGSKLLASAKSLYSGNDRSKWFALFRVDEKIDDETLFQGVPEIFFVFILLVMEAFLMGVSLLKTRLSLQFSEIHFCN